MVLLVDGDSNGFGFVEGFAQMVFDPPDGIGGEAGTHGGVEFLNGDPKA